MGLCMSGCNLFTVFGEPDIELRDTEDVVRHCYVTGGNDPYHPGLFLTAGGDSTARSACS
jgi:hypothetical protein